MQAIEAEVRFPEIVDQPANKLRQDIELIQRGFTTVFVNTVDW